VLNFLNGLAGRCQVKLLAFGNGPPLPVPGVSTVSVGRGVFTLASENLRRPDVRLPLQVRLYLDARMRRAVAREAHVFKPHVLHATLSRMAPYLICGPWHRHLDLVDPASLNMDSRAQAMEWPQKLPFAAEARLARHYEARASAFADSVSLVSEVDRLQAGLEQAVVIPIGVDESTFFFKTPVHRNNQLVFFGNLGYFHNVQAASFVVHEVMPRLRTRVGDASLRIVGARPAASVMRLNGVNGAHVEGPVPRMVDELHRAAVALLPVFSGSGMQNKILEAFSAGTPVVTTSRTIRAIPSARPGVHCLIGDTAEELAEACARLLSDEALRLEIAHAARRLTEKRYAVGAQAECLLSLYRPAGEGGGRA
jgi:glycosyltransferase involved in cell wall biosynthesis